MVEFQRPMAPEFAGNVKRLRDLSLFPLCELATQYGIDPNGVGYGRLVELLTAKGVSATGDYASYQALLKGKSSKKPKPPKKPKKPKPPK